MIDVIVPDQQAKADAGKPRLSLVPTQILYDICKVREFAVDHKYKNPDNWKNVEIQRYRDAAFRHFLLYLRDPDGVDEESGLPHYYHICCNLAFICEIEAGNVKTVDTKKQLKVTFPTRHDKGFETDWIVDFDEDKRRGKRSDAGCLDDWVVDFDENEFDNRDWIKMSEEKPPKSGVYEFTYGEKSKVTQQGYWQGYYISASGAVLIDGLDALRNPPKYWRYIE